MIRRRVALAVAAMLPACGADRVPPAKSSAHEAGVAVSRIPTPPAHAPPREDAHALVLAPRLPPPYSADDAARLRSLVDDYLSARKAQIEERGARLVPAATRDRIARALAEGKLAADGPTCRTPPTLARVLRKMDAPADLAVAQIFVTKSSSGRDELLVEARVGGNEPARRLMVVTSVLDSDRDLARAVAKLDDDANAASPPFEAPHQAAEAKDPYEKQLCALGLRPWAEARSWSSEIDHGPLPHAALHRCITKGRPEKLTPETSLTVDVSLDLADDGRIERLRVSRVAPDVAACLEALVREVPFSCPAVAGTIGGTLEIRTVPSNTPGCAAGSRSIGGASH